MTRRVLVPLDDSPHAWDAFEYALEEYPEAEIVVVHVIDPKRSLLEGQVRYTQEDRRRAEERADNIVEKSREIADSFDLSVTTAIEQGSPADTIIEFADEHDVDQIVMGSHGRSGLARILLGSVAETVARRAPVPVTILR